MDRVERLIVLAMVFAMIWHITGGGPPDWPIVTALQDAVCNLINAKPC